MKNEHIEFDELYRLAEIEVQGEVYSEEEKKELQHLIECEECYERYCAAALSLAALDGINAETLAVMAEKGDFEKAESNVDFPALGNPTKPTSASNFNSIITVRSCIGSPGCAKRGA